MKHRSRIVEGMKCEALFSEDERYRYDLRWEWKSSLPSLVAFMLNPSTATHEVLDPTVRGCKLRAEERGFGGVRVINLFAYRATDPKDMKKMGREAIGKDNDRTIMMVLDWAALTNSPVFAGWGKHGTHLNRDCKIVDLLHRSQLTEVRAFKLNADGSPQHPLYVPRALEPVTYWSRN